MEQPLSQAEIDALMRSLLSDGGEDLVQGGGKVRPYDFRRPSKFKKDLLRTLMMIHDNYARLLQSFFSANLRTRVTVQLRGTNQYSYSEYVQMLPSPTVVATIRMEPLPSTFLMDISQNIAFAIIDLVLGGDGSAVDQPKRALSEIEIGVIQRVMTGMLGPLQESWRGVLDVTPAVEGVETNPLFVQVTNSSEVVAAITIAVSIGEHKGHITLALPYSMMDPILSRLSGGEWASRHQGASMPGGSRFLSHSLSGAPVEVRAVLGKATITVAELASLQVGDLIPLRSRVGDPIPVYVSDRLTYRGQPGTVGRRMAVKVSQFTNGGVGIS